MIQNKMISSAPLSLIRKAKAKQAPAKPQNIDQFMRQTEARAAAGDREAAKTLAVLRQLTKSLRRQNGGRQ